MSNSVQPQRRQPTRLPCPWDSPGKNTGVGCHLLLQCMKVKRESEVAQSCLTPSDPMDCSPPGPSVHGIFQARVLEWGVIAFSGIERYRVANWIRNQDLSFCCLQKPCYRAKDTHSLKMREEWKNVFHGSGNNNKAQVAIL